MEREMMMVEEAVFKPTTVGGRKASPSSGRKVGSGDFDARFRLFSFVLVVLLTSIAGYLCGNGIHALCPPHPPLTRPSTLDGAMDKEIRRPEAATTPPVPKTCGDDERVVKLDGGGMVTGSAYFLRLCRRNSSRAGAFYDELRLEREEKGKNGVLVAKWSWGEWRQMVERLSNCYPLHSRARCLAPRGPDPQFCPRASLLKQGLLLCYDVRFGNLASIRFGNVQLSRIETIVFVETSLFWVP